MLNQLSLLNPYQHPLHPLYVWISIKRIQVFGSMPKTNSKTSVLVSVWTVTWSLEAGALMHAHLKFWVVTMFRTKPNHLLFYNTSQVNNQHSGFRVRWIRIAIALDNGTIMLTTPVVKWSCIHKEMWMWLLHTKKIWPAQLMKCLNESKTVMSIRIISDESLHYGRKVVRIFI